MALLHYEYGLAESLADIAKRHNVTVEAMMNANGIPAPYPYDIGGLDEDILTRLNGYISIPYVTNGGDTFESYSEQVKDHIGCVYKTEEELQMLSAIAAQNALPKTTTVYPNNAPMSNTTECYIVIAGTRLHFPCFPESVSDSTQVNYQSVPILGRSEPFQVYNNSGPRTVSARFRFHLDMADDGILNSTTFEKVPILSLVYAIESCCYPQYENAVAATPVYLRIGDSIEISGIVTSVNTEHSGPLLSNAPDPNNVDFIRPRYALIDLSLTVTECTGKPKSQRDIMSKGGFFNK